MSMSIGGAAFTFRYPANCVPSSLHFHPLASELGFRARPLPGVSETWSGWCAAGGRFRRVVSSPMVSLASSVHAGPSAFALLLGSGISTGSGVLSGWEMTIDLIRRLAVLQGQDPGDDPVCWYRERFGGEPDYSDVLQEPGTVSRRPQEPVVIVL